MATVAFKGSPVQTAGNLPAVGKTAPDFRLTNAGLEDVGLTAFAGKRKILNIVPSLDTGVCALSAQRFNTAVGALQDVALLTISADLPFAAARFCDSQKLAHVTTLSTFRAPEFGTAYGVKITAGPLAGLMTRAVLVLDAGNTILHAQLVPEITQEPDYDAALAVL